MGAKKGSTFTVWDAYDAECVLSAWKLSAGVLSFVSTSRLSQASVCSVLNGIINLYMRERYKHTLPVHVALTEAASRFALFYALGYKSGLAFAAWYALTTFGMIVFNAHKCHLLCFTSKSIFGMVEHVMVLTHHSTQRWQQASVNIGACAAQAVCMARCVSMRRGKSLDMAIRNFEQLLVLNVACQCVGAIARGGG